MGVGISTADEAVAHIVAGGIIAILRLERPEDLLPAAGAIRQGGVTTIEVSFASPDAMNALGPARARLGHGVLLGVGMVLTPEAARDAIRAGAQFMAAPTLNPEVVRACQEAHVSVIAGAFTASEIVHAWELGSSPVKVFPAGTVGAGYIREILASLPHVRLVPTGGVTLENVGDFIRAGAAAVGAGAGMIPEYTLARKEFSEITRRARAFAEAVQRAREQVRRPVQPVRPIEGPDIR